MVFLGIAIGFSIAWLLYSFSQFFLFLIALVVACLATFMLWRIKRQELMKGIFLGFLCYSIFLGATYLYFFVILS